MSNDPLRELRDLVADWERTALLDSDKPKVERINGGGIGGAVALARETGRDAGRKDVIDSVKALLTKNGIAPIVVFRP